MTDKPDKKAPLPPSANAVYDRMLGRVEKALADAEIRTWETLKREIEAVVAFEHDVAELTREEVDLLGAYLKRDLASLVSFARETNAGLKGWLKMDITLIEERLADMLLSIADKTQVDQMLLDHKLHHLPGQYVSGELAAPGVLRCAECGHTLCLTATTHVEDCHACGTHYFERVTGRWPHEPEIESESEA